MAYPLGSRDSLRIRANRQGRIIEDQVAAPVGIIEITGQPSRLVQPFIVGQGSDELRQVMPVQLRQPLNHESLRGRGRNEEAPSLAPAIVTPRLDRSSPLPPMRAAGVAASSRRPVRPVPVAVIVWRIDRQGNARS